MTSSIKTISRKDYQPYPFEIKKVELFFNLEAKKSYIKSQLYIKSKQTQATDLVLDGEAIELIALYLDGEPLSKNQYHLLNNQLIIPQVKGEFTLTIENYCFPEDNSTLMGLYVSNQQFFTQCEAEGFRRITFYPDRPDVMSIFTVTIQADKDKYPHLLSNGNLISEKDINNGQHETIWHDPFSKPSYLFALVAGHFDILEKNVQTRQGKNVLLQVYSDKGSKSQTTWALSCLENALRWDEDRFDLELDLERFMIVAVHDFNMGAMENKGLNIFNAAYVLASPETSTDDNYAAIESVIGHEYFHNWTGNRVTCRDWFQLSLKEGLTVFRDQEFSADMAAKGLDSTAARSARTVKRIDDVAILRRAQFPEDAGPMAHPIRPERYEEISNFYTATIYEKGAAIIRMFHTLLGEARFQEGIKEYFKRYDGQAVTCDDFIETMEWAYQKDQPKLDFKQFSLWYSQAGTPKVTVNLTYDKNNRSCILKLKQECAKVGIEKQINGYTKHPFHIPILIGLINQKGEAIQFKLNNQSHDEVLLELKKETQEWVLEDVNEAPIPSLLRNFSAPIRYEYNYSLHELEILATQDPNFFARWEATQILASKAILEPSDKIINSVIHVWENNLLDNTLDKAYQSRLLKLPDINTLLDNMDPIDPLALDQQYEIIKTTLAKNHRELWLNFLKEEIAESDTLDPILAGKRSLRNLAIHYLLSIQDNQTNLYAMSLFENAKNMTDRLGALQAISNYGSTDIRFEALRQFFEQWQSNALVVDKWFALQATSRANNLQKIKGLMAHPTFNLRNPNRARALIFQFCLNNITGFHNTNDPTYEFWAQQVKELDKLNPEISARLARALENWPRYDEPYQGKMKAALLELSNDNSLSNNVKEILSKSLTI